MTDDQRAELAAKAKAKMKAWSDDWNKFIRDAFDARLDKEQQAIITSVQFNSRTSVSSGTARGKDFVTACAAMAFMYMTPKWNKKKEMVANTKVALTAPTDRQVKNIMMPEIARLHGKAKRRGIILPGRLNTYDIRTDNEEWFLTGFKADEHNHEAWSGFHAVNTLFAVTEATGILDDTFEAIEGNLQGNSRLLIVFNPNTTVGYAAKSQKGNRFTKFRLNSLTAPNVVEKKIVIPGQVDYEWILDKLENWCERIDPADKDEKEDDFEFEGIWYRPSDLFRRKVLGKPPKVSEDVLIPEQWIELAQARWEKYEHHNSPLGTLRLGVDVAGMGRDNTVFCPRYDNYVHQFRKLNSDGKAEHMQIAGNVKVMLDNNFGATAQIDTIGEGAGVFSRLIELGYEGSAFSCKYSEGAYDDSGKELNDITGIYTFANMRAFLFWCVRDWLDPKNDTGAMIPPGSSFTEEATEIKWKFRSDGKILIEPKEDIKKRLGRSTDEFDALANTFYAINPADTIPAEEMEDYF